MALTPAVDIALSVKLAEGSTYELVCAAMHDRHKIPESNRNFREASKTTFLGPSDPNYRLYIDDIPLESVKGRASAWSWSPQFYAGEVQAVLRDNDGNACGCWYLDVSPDGKKLGREAFIRMLTEIRKYDESLILGAEPSRSQFGSLGTLQNPVVEFLRLRYRADAISYSLGALLREPISTLRTRRRVVPLHSVRRADRRTTRATLTQPALLVAIGALQNTADINFSQRTQVNVPDVEHHLDNALNGCLLYAVQGLLRRTENLLDVLEEKSRDIVSDTKTRIGERWPQWKPFLVRFRRHLRFAVRQIPFSEVSEPKITAAGLNAVAAHPLCARFWRLSWEALRHGIAGREPTDWLPLNPTWEIYERWCFLKLDRWLRNMMPDDTTWQVSSPSGVGRLLTGRATDGTVVRLHLQRQFRNSKGMQRQYWSVSRERYPDIVLTWQGCGKHRFLIFDAKYRVKQGNVLKAMESAHIYNDSLRMNDSRPVASILLVPAPTEVPFLETHEYFSRHRCGALPLHPDVKLPSWFDAHVRKLLSRN